MTVPAGDLGRRGKTCRRPRSRRWAPPHGGVRNTVRLHFSVPFAQCQYTGDRSDRNTVFPRQISLASNCTQRTSRVHVFSLYRVRQPPTVQRNHVSCATRPERGNAHRYTPSLKTLLALLPEKNYKKKNKNKMNKTWFSIILMLLNSRIYVYIDFHLAKHDAIWTQF